MKLHPRDVPGVVATVVATAIGLALMVSGSSMAPASGPALAERTRELELGATTESLLVAQLEHQLGTHEAPQLPEGWQELFRDTPNAKGELRAGNDQAIAARLLEGRASYQRNCQHCHGVRGDASTQTAKILLPRPRDFSLGLTKFKQTPGLLPPLREDLHRILEQGVASTAMADFAMLEEAERTTLVDYVQYLLMRGAVESRVAGALQTLAQTDGAQTADPAEVEFRVLEGTRVALEAVGTEWRNAPGTAFTEVPAPADDAAIARGAELYKSAKAGCAQCHGIDGKGRGLGAWDAEHGWILRDVWGNPVRPADFSYGSFHGGGSPEQVYRSISLGIAGTPMAGYAGVLSPSEITDLAHYLRSLSD